MLLPARAAGCALARALCERVRHGRAELDLLPPREPGSGRKMGRADAARLRLRREGEPLPDAHEAADRPRAWRGALLRVDRAARGEREARTGDLAAAGVVPPRRRPPRRGARARERAPARPPRLRVPPSVLVRPGGRGAAARARRSAGDRRSPGAPLPDPLDDDRLDARALPPWAQRPARQLLRGGAARVGVADRRVGAARRRLRLLQQRLGGVRAEKRPAPARAARRGGRAVRERTGADAPDRTGPGVPSAASPGAAIPAVPRMSRPGLPHHRSDARAMPR